MEGPENRGPGYDDWFDEPEPPTETQSGANRGVHEDAEEVWVLPEDEEAHSTGQREVVIGGRTFTMTQVAIIALSAVAILLAILAAAGVFNSGKAAAPPVSTPTVPPPKTTTTQTNTTPAVAAPSTTLKPGDTGEQVKTLQRALTQLGYQVTADGDYGPATQAAVQQFQTAKGLTPDGVVGPVTLAELQKSLGG
jgi:hypothetical protein